MADGDAPSAARQIDMASLPGAVADFLDALPPGEVLVVRRGRDRVTTITAVGDPVEGIVIGGRADDGPPPAGRRDVTVVATAMKLSKRARGALSVELGSGYIVLDMYAAPRTAEVLLVPPISVHLLARLRSMFPAARLFVVELEDPELGVSYGGPVRRLLDSGADAYLTSVTVPALARRLDRAVGPRGITADPASSGLESAE